MAKMTWTNTNDAFSSVGGIMVRSLREELKFQKHRATGALSRGLKKSKMFNIKNGKAVNINSSVAYWKTVSNPKNFKGVSLTNILKWVRIKGFAKGNEVNAANRIYYRMMKEPFGNAYGKPYILWTDGNSLRRMNFEKWAVKQSKDKIVAQIEKGVVKDVVKLIKTTIKENVGTNNVRFIK